MDKLTLLVADDVEMNRTVIGKLLGRDFHVLEAENGLQVLEILEQKHVDVMILDIIMPEMDGLETLEAIRKKPEWNPIGVLVATTKKEQTERMALSAGADDVVAKPYDPIVIKQRISNILAKKEMDKMQIDDIKGISRQDRRTVDQKLYSLREKCQLASKNLDNQELTKELIKEMGDEVDFLVNLLTTREGY